MSSTAAKNTSRRCQWAAGAADARYSSDLPAASLKPAGQPSPSRKADHHPRLRPRRLLLLSLLLSFCLPLVRPLQSFSSLLFAFEMTNQKTKKIKMGLFDKAAVNVSKQWISTEALSVFSLSRTCASIRGWGGWSGAWVRAGPL